jgi:hypothetical protein
MTKDSRRDGDRTTGAIDAVIEGRSPGATFFSPFSGRKIERPGEVERLEAREAVGERRQGQSLHQPVIGGRARRC